MVNPILQLMNQQVNNEPQLEQLKTMFKSGGNPYYMLPKQIQDLLRVQSPEQLFYSMCKQQGINPQNILDYLRK